MKLLLCVILVILPLIWSSPLGKSRHRATHVPPERRKPFSSLFIIPNTYHDIPRHRYPYYDEHGRGKLLYGYGGRTLYKYSVFRPLEGYYRK